MPFTSLLLTALQPDKKLEENHVGVVLIPSEEEEGETFLLFKSDSKHFHTVYLQRTQPDKSTPSCCDGVCFAQKGILVTDKKWKREITICLIELKGGKQDMTKEAVEQILRTRDGIQAGIDRSEIQGVNINWKALIVSKSSLPENEIEKILRELKNTFGNKNVKHTHQSAGNINLIKFIKTNEIRTV